MLNEVNFSTEYRTGSSNDPRKLIKLALPNSRLYRGRPAIFKFNDKFIRNRNTRFCFGGGLIELMCSPIMSRRFTFN